MKAPCILKRLSSGIWSACHSSPALGTVEVTARTKDEALTKMQGELQYRIELCPCSGVSGDTVVIQETEEGSPPP